ncbi:MAG: hypothetical protein KDI56_00425 [Xanthomonadales bacterium]|nr:hypothetical protein [Xanthomonadales bacterium]
MTEPAADVELPEPSEPAKLTRFLDHLERFADSTAARAARWLTPLRVYAALVLLGACWCAWRLSGGALGFLGWVLPLALPAGLLFAFYLVFSTIAELPAQLADLRQALASLATPVRQRIDGLMSRSEGSRFGLGRILAIGSLLLELRRIDELRSSLPDGVAMAPLMANPLFWLLFLITALVGLAVLGLATLLLLIAL